MTTEVLGAWGGFLRGELTVDRARAVRMAGMTGCASLLATVFLIYRVPLPAYGAYVAVMAYQRDTAASLTLSIGALVAAMAAIAFSTLLYLFDVDEPALRIPVMAIVMFGAMYFSRAPRVGPVLFLCGFVLVVTQTLIDQIPDGETLTHILLWLALVILCPCLLVPLVQSIAGRKPKDLFADGVNERRTRAAATLSLRAEHAPSVSVRELSALAARLGAPALNKLAAVLQLEQIAGLRCDEEKDPLHKDLLHRVELDLTDQFEHPDQDTGTPLPHPMDGPAQRQSLRFAFKATLAAMLCYILYSGFDWTGIRTSIITCFFVALGSTGETVHKLSLRIAGALIGGLLAGLSIVFLFPVMDDIGGFIVLFACATLLCMWVATASPLIAYAGLQMTFAFYLGVLQDTGPTDDLTVLRDRLAGIVLGNVVMSLVFSTLWPVSTLASAKAALARCARRQAHLLALGQPVASADIVSATTDLEDASRLAAMAAFDLGVTPDRRAHRPALTLPLARVMAWSNAWLHGVSTPAPQSASRLDAVAQYLEGRTDAIAHPWPADSALPAAMSQAIDALEQETIHARA
jgi:multidrug resistance protein MdtO